MMRLAVGGKLGNPGSPPVVVALASRWRRVARAASPGTDWVRRWRRVRSGRLVLLIGDYLVEVQDQAGYGGVGGQVGGVQVLVARGISVGEVFFGGFGIGLVALLEAGQGLL